MLKKSKIFWIRSRLHYFPWYRMCRIYPDHWAKLDDYLSYPRHGSPLRRNQLLQLSHSVRYTSSRTPTSVQPRNILGLSRLRTLLPSFRSSVINFVQTLRSSLASSLSLPYYHPPPNSTNYFSQDISFQSIICSSTPSSHNPKASRPLRKYSNFQRRRPKRPSNIIPGRKNGVQKFQPFRLHPFQRQASTFLLLLWQSPCKNTCPHNPTKPA